MCDVLVLFCGCLLLGPATRQAHARLALALVVVVRLAQVLVVALCLSVVVVNLAPGPCFPQALVLIVIVHRFWHSISSCVVGSAEIGNITLQYIIRAT